jgi:chemotaxis protein histidine kinase CheA
MVESIEFDSKWQELKRRFEERLVNRFEVIDQAWQKLSALPSDEEALSTLFHQVHSLAGSGATFGYDELSQSARVVEPLIDPLGLASGEPLDRPRLDQIERGLTEIRREARNINAAI